MTIPIFSYKIKYILYLLNFRNNRIFYVEPRTWTELKTELQIRLYNYSELLQWTLDSTL